MDRNVMHRYRVLSGIRSSRPSLEESREEQPETQPEDRGELKQEEIAESVDHFRVLAGLNARPHRLRK